jgi:hypothetical protein
MESDRRQVKTFHPFLHHPAARGARAAPGQHMEHSGGQLGNAQDIVTPPEFVIAAKYMLHVTC